MELKQMKCPNCGAMLTVEDGLDMFFCKYCGTKIILEGQSDAAYHAKTKLKEYEHEERKQRAEYEHEERIQKEKYARERRNDRQVWLILIFMFLIPTVIVVSSAISNKSNIKKLEKTVEEVQSEIDAGNYDSALIKADSIRYTADWSSDEEKAWNERRENLIDMIRNAQQRDINQTSNLVVMNSSAEEYLERNFKDVQNELEKLGFNKVLLEELEEKAGLFKRKDVVHHVTINGEDDFKEKDVFDKASDVVVYIYKQ